MTTPMGHTGRWLVNQRKLRTYQTHLYMGTAWLRRRRGQR